MHDCDRIENNLLAWIRTVTIFFIAGIALQHYTDSGKYYSIISFLILVVLLTTLLLDYINQRSELISKGYKIRLSLDVMASAMMVLLFVVFWILYNAISNL